MSVTGGDDKTQADDDPTPPSGFPMPQLPPDQVATIQQVGPSTPGPWSPPGAPGMPGGPGIGPFAPPPVPPKPRRSYRKVWLTLLSAVLAVVLLAVGYTVVRYLVDSSTYDDGHQAYQRADCAAAVTEFDSVITAWRLVKLGDTVARAESEKAECLAYQEGASKQQAGDNPAAIAAFAKFIPGRPQSPLTDAARGRVTTLFQLPEVAKLATTESCDALQVLRDEKLLVPAAAPGFHAACGAAYKKAGDKTKALATYSRLFADYGKEKVAADTEAELLKDPGWCDVLAKFRDDQVLATRADLLPGLLSTCAKDATTNAQAFELAEEFLEKYPGHRFTPDVLATFAGRLNQEARSEPRSAKELGGADVIRSIGGDKAVILLHNDSDEPLRIALSGPEPRVEEVEPCPNCPQVEGGDNVCREQATVKRIELAPGDYDMTVDTPGRYTTAPGFSHWLLQPGKEYFACYRLTRSSS